MADTAGLRVCPGTLARQAQRLSAWLGGEYESIKTRLRRGKVAYAEETGHRNNGRNGWLWTVADPRHTLYHVDESRSGKVIRGLLGEAFGGTLVCDFYGGYDAMNCPKQRCNTHLLRELRDTAKDNPIFAAHPLCRRGKRLIKDLLKFKSRWRKLNDAAYTRKACRLEDRLDKLAKSFSADPDPDVRRIATRMLRYQKELTAFLWDKHVDGTNNAAERALRPAVVFRKITGGSRSTAGAQPNSVEALQGQDRKRHHLPRPKEPSLGTTTTRPPFRPGSRASEGPQRDHDLFFPTLVDQSGFDGWC